MRIIASQTRLLSCAVAVLAAVNCTPEENNDQGSLTGPPALASSEASAYDIVKVGSMTVDGNLSEWTNVPVISMADDPGNGRGALNNSATVKLAWNDTYLYAAYNVTDTELLALQTVRDHDEIFKDDEIELYIDPQGDGAGATTMSTTDYQFLANVREALGDNRGTGTASKDASYNAASFLAKAVTNGTLNATGTDVGYTVELRISWSDLGVAPAAGNFMRIDPAVGDRDGTALPPVQSFDWAGLTSYNNPSGWTQVRLVNPPPPVSAYNIVKVGGTGMTVDGNLSDWAGVAAISMADDPARGAAANSASVKLAWNDTHLYAAYDVTDTELLALQTARDHADIYKDDEVELYIDPQGDGASAASMTPTDYQFLANVREAVRETRGNGTGGKDASYNAASFLAKAITNGTLGAPGADVGYTVELRISWSDLGITPTAGHFMRIDPAVGDRDGSGPPPVNDFDWAALATFNNPGGWKDVQLVVDNTAPAAATNPTLTVVSSSQINVGWTASTSTDVAKYNIYRGTTGTPTLLTSVKEGPHQDTTLTASTSYTYQVATVDAAGNEAPKTAPVSATTAGGQALGIPYGPFHLFATTTSTQTHDVENFNLDHSLATAGNLVARINAARSKGIKLVLTIPGSSHSPWKTNGVFDMAKWKAGVDAFNDSTNRQAVANAVADGTIVGNSVIDEPNHADWGPAGTMTKVRIDEMCGYVKNAFPTLPTGPVVVHWWRYGHRGDPKEFYRVCDFIIDQYDWWQSPNGPGGGQSGNITGWRDAALQMAQENGISIAFSMNIINGGVQDIDAPIDWTCPPSTTGGPGDRSPVCRMSATQVRDYGLVLGRAGCWLLMWEYRSDFMAKPENKDAFADVAGDLATRPAHACRRTG